MPPRRQSISFQPSAPRPGPSNPVGRKRSHSMAPGELAPRDRRALAPRKSILKAPPVFIEEAPYEPPLSAASASTALLLEDMTTSMDLTRDFRTEVHDNTSRKSMGRRVSFASHAHVRLFEIQEQNTNSSGAPSSSPPPSSPAQSHLPPAAPQLSDENDYPGRRLSAAPRPSVAFSENGERSMSMDEDEDQDEDDDHEPLPPSIFFPPGAHSERTEQSDAGFDDEDEDDDDDDDMEITEAIALNIHRKRSLSLGVQPAKSKRRSSIRRRSSIKPAPPADVSSEGDAEGEQAMEFTVPLAKALSQPKPPSEAWLALQAVTHSSNIPDEPGSDEHEDMDLTSAITRLSKARMSYEFAPTAQALVPAEHGGVQEMDEDGAGASFTSTEDSFDGDGHDMGDRTVNVTNLLGSVRELEISGTEDIVDTGASDFAGRIPQLTTSVHAISGKNPGQVRRQSEVPPPAPPAVGLNVFSAPVAPLAFSVPVAEDPKTVTQASGATSSELTRPTSPAKSQAAASVFSTQVPPKSPQIPPGPTANNATPPSPKKPLSPVKKRPAPSSQDDENNVCASPAKKRAVGLGASPTKKAPSAVTPFSPTKNRVNVPASSAPATSGAKKATVTAGRRPSGYFAQRKSLVPGGPATLATTTVNDTPLSQSTRVLPKKLAFGGREFSPPRHDVAQKENVDVAFEQDANEFQASHLVVRVEEISRVPERELGEHSVTVGDKQAIRSRSELQVEESREEEDDEPPISIEQFFMMTGVKFMDELTIPRPSMAHPSLLQKSTRATGDPPSLSEFIMALSVDIPQLELYSWVAKDLQKWLGDGKRNFRQAEEEAIKMTPGLFREFLQANEEGRSELLHQVKLIKANCHSVAKSQWYDWKYQWIENLDEMARKGEAQLEADKVAISELIASVEDNLPALRMQHAQILLQLEHERAEVAEIEGSDPIYLAELKVTIVEQNALLDAFRADVAESQAKVERLNEKLAEVQLQKRENVEAIKESERMIQVNKNSTRAEVFRLKDELESLQALHLWRATRILPHHLEFVYDECFVVTIPCAKFRPSGPVSITVHQTDSKNPSSQRFPALVQYAMLQARLYAARTDTTTVKQIIETLGDFWASCTQIRSQLMFLGIKYPLEIETETSDPSQGGTGFKATATVLFHGVKAKAHISFVFDWATALAWPMSIRSVGCEVNVAYGPVDPEVVRNAVMERLAQATVEDNHACLLDACVEATTRYE